MHALGIHEGTTLITASAHATTVISIADYIRARFPKVSCDVGAREKKRGITFDETRHGGVRQDDVLAQRPVSVLRASKLRAVRKSGRCGEASVRAICRLELPSRRFIYRGSRYYFPSGMIEGWTRDAAYTATVIWMSNELPNNSLTKTHRVRTHGHYGLQESCVVFQY